jgi:flagella basal body P-ring formation protein FlgA
MNRSFVHLILVGGSVLLIAPFAWAGGTSSTSPLDEPLLHIHLPREMTVQTNMLNLGEISVVRGEKSLVTAAGKIGLGRLSVPGQKVVVDRTTILSRLASHGIPGDRVRLTGAESVVVRREQEIIDGAEFIAMAELFLKQSPSLRSVSESIAVTRPKDMVLPQALGDVQVTPRFVRNGARGFATVQIVVAVGGKEIGSRDIPFRLRYRCRRPVTSQEIAEGTILTPENVKIEEVTSDRPEPSGWKPPYGLVATRVLSANVEIRQDMVNSPQPAVMIRRNETVVIRVEAPGLLVTAVGIALQEARSGEYVKVRNTDSNRVIVCKVNKDGTVRPVL